MSPGRELKISDKSSASFKFFTYSGTGKIKTICFWKRKLSFGIFLLLIILVILYFLKYAILPKTAKSRKTKRHLNSEAFDQERNYKMSTQDVQIIPETFEFQFNNKRVNEYANHRYTEDDSEDSNLVEKAQGRKDWTPEILKPRSRNYGSDFREAELEKKKEETGKLEKELSKGSVFSMRLKGVYMQPGSKTSNKLNEKFDYSKEINNLIQRGSNLDVKRERSQKKTFKNRGAPFQLPGREKDSSRGRPITIFLDFSPMPEDRFRKRKSSPPRKRRPHMESGMTMKLILYPKEKEVRTYAGRPPPRYKERAGRKFEGWFAKDKEKETNCWKECSIMGLNPPGKHITAKWKDENSD